MQLSAPETFRYRFRIVDASLRNTVGCGFCTCEVACTVYCKSIDSKVAACGDRIGCFVAAYSVGYVKLTESYRGNCLSLLLSVVGKGFAKSIGRTL